MNSYEATALRNFAVVGHQAAGKTTLCEAMLARAGVIGRMGSIDAGTTVSDYHEDEHDHHMSIHSSLLRLEWMDRKFNILDTPGCSDFISESLAALRVGDFALVVVNGQNGIEPGTLQVWDQAGRHGLPKMLVINGLDKEHCRFEEILEELQAEFGDKVFPFTIPLNSGPGFNRVLDVLRTVVATYTPGGDGQYTELPAEGADLERVRVLHRELIELVAESDDTLLQKFFDQEGLSEDELRSGIHAAVQSQQVIPLFAASASTNVGVARMMDFIAKYGSSPTDRRIVQAQDAEGRDVDVDLAGSDPVIYFFKTISEPHVGDLSFFRVYSGRVKPGMDLYNPTRKISERIGQIFVLNGKERTQSQELFAGDIGAMVKLRDTHTGDTLCHPKASITLDRIAYPEPSYRAALVLKRRGEEEKVAQGLAALHREDPTFVHRFEPELRQTVLSGQGETHLTVVVERLRRQFRVEVELTEPRVAYRETIRANGEAKYRHKKQSGGAGQFAEVWLRVEPLPRDSGVVFTESLVGQNVDRAFVPSVEKGIMSACTEGIFAGYRVVDLKVNFYDGKMHPVDSKDIAFQIAGKAAFRDAFTSARPCLLEPICQVEAIVPEECLGDVIGDFSSKRGRILGIDTDGRMQTIRALVPQKELYKYSTRLRSLTAGRGRHRESLSHYDDLPAELEAHVIAEAKEFAARQT